MKIYLSALEASKDNYLILKNIQRFRFILVSYYYAKKDMFHELLNRSDYILIDSGAHSFQKGKKVDWLQYTKQYAEFIKQNDCDKIVGYFEMDVDNIIGYEKVKELRKILEAVSDKIIPVWHKNRGIDNFVQMCKDYAGKWVAITGFKNEDIKDEQYPLFLRTAHKYGCKVHCLGMTRRKVLDKVPFDSVDSSSWKQEALYGKVGKKKVTKQFSKEDRPMVLYENFRHWLSIVDEYYNKWKRYE